MNNNIPWVLLFAIIGLCTLWYTVKAINQAQFYFSLDTKVEPDSIEWSIFSISEEQFVLNAHTIYKIKERVYQADNLLPEPKFRNTWSAEQSLPFYKNQTWKIWVASGAPQSAALIKQFPYKEIASASVLWLLLLYFLGLGYYVARQKQLK